MQPPSGSSKSTTDPGEGLAAPLDVFCSEAKSILTDHLTVRNMLSMSESMRKQILDHAETSNIAMLPSFNYTLPSGKEKGTYLALDIGGSTLRVALVELSSEDGHIDFRQCLSYAITEDVRLMDSKAFFSWIADRIHDLLALDGSGYESKIPLLMGVSWSFPIQQTSISSGRILPMGKGFRCLDDGVGQDLNQLITEACVGHSLNVRVAAIINDSSATLLSQAYVDPTTRMSLILGTGTNSATYLPARMIPKHKFGCRHGTISKQGRHVIVNTELSLIGGDNTLPRSRWDEMLNHNHIKPDFQPLEYMTSGAYLGEIVRLIISDAVRTAGLFGGRLPHTMKNPYSFDTIIVAVIEADTSPTLCASSAFLQQKHTFLEPPSQQDLAFLKKICSFVSMRAAAYVAICLHGLSAACQEFESPSSSVTGCRLCEKTGSILTPLKVAPTAEAYSIACDGTVIREYPNFRVHCQDYLDQLHFACRDELSLCAMHSVYSKAPERKKTPENGKHTRARVVLNMATESCLYGTAVASAIAATVPLESTILPFPN